MRSGSNLDFQISKAAQGCFRIMPALRLRIPQDAGCFPHPYGAELRIITAPDHLPDILHTCFALFPTLLTCI